MTKIFAHRGFRAMYPENTLLSFKKAFELGVDGIELDVHMTRDGEIVVIHDESLKRTTGVDGEVIDYTYAELKKSVQPRPFVSMKIMTAHGRRSVFRRFAKY